MQLVYTSKELEFLGRGRKRNDLDETIGNKENTFPLPPPGSEALGI